jgi:hypothetical protein
MAQGAQCGSMSDGCGNILACGMCTAPDVCGVGGPNKCGTGTCVPKTCVVLHDDCGSVSDGCGGTLDCGMCTLPETCGGAGAANRCGCRPKTCDAVGAKCGVIDDGCGGMNACQACPHNQTCVANQCVRN